MIKGERLVNKQIICCGNISFDLILSDDKKNMTFHARPGGSVFNVALLLSRLGMPVSMLAKNAQDFLGNALLKIMAAEGISTEHIIPEKHIKTGLALARIDKKGDSSYLFYRVHGPHIAFGQKDLPSSLFRNASVFHTGSGFSYSDGTFESTLKSMIKAKKYGLFTSYDPNWRQSRIKNKKRDRKRIHKLIAHADLLKLSNSDAMEITDKKTLLSAINHLPPNIVVTMGEKGSFFWDGKKKYSCSAFKVKVSDTIGGGDAFTSGLIYRFCALGPDRFWEEMKENLLFSSAVSAIVCTGRGATESLKSIRQVEKFLKTRRKH